MVTSHAKALRPEKTWSHLMRKHFDQKKHGHISCESTSTRKNMVTSHAKALRPEKNMVTSHAKALRPEKTWSACLGVPSTRNFGETHPKSLSPGDMRMDHVNLTLHQPHHLNSM